MLRAAIVRITAVLGLLLTAAPAKSAVLTFTCDEEDVGKPSTMTVTYEGEADGTMKVVASFGEMSFPAYKTAGQVEVDGQTVPQIDIYGFGKARVLMPVKAGLEACITAKRSASDTNDAASIKDCHPTLDTTTMEVDAEISIALASYLPGPSVTVRRTYLEQSEDYLDGSGEPGGYMTVENGPLPKCTLAQ